MFNFSKMMIQTRSLMNLRHSAPVYNINNISSSNYSMKAFEEKAGLPERPKKPLTPYFRFLKSIRANVARENPNMKVLEVVQECAKRWNTYDESKKESLNAEYQKEKESYIKEKAIYENSLTDTHRELIQGYKQDLVDYREKRAYRKKVREMEKPKRPATGFLRYLSKRYGDKNRGTLDYRQFQSKVAEEWNSMDEAGKKSYVESFEAELKEYKRELAKWELKMIRMGYVELVRQDSLVENTPQPLVKRQGRPRSQN